MKKPKKNFYAVYYIDTKEKKILDSWQKCQKAIKGHPNLFKGFIEEADAKMWLDNITQKQISQHQKNHNRKKPLIEQKKKEAEKLKQSKKYEFILDRELSKHLDNFLLRTQMSVSQFIAEIVQTDLIDE